MNDVEVSQSHKSCEPSRASRAFSYERAKYKPGLLAAIALTVFLQSGCGARAVEMNVVVFNYWPRAMADVYVNEQHVGAGYGAYGPGGTGSKISCCYSVKPGIIRVGWMLGGGEGDPMTGTTMSATAELKEIKPHAEYLAVYLYPDGTVDFDTGKGMPDGRPSSVSKR